MEARCLASFIGILHTVCLWTATPSGATKAPNDSRFRRKILWAPCAIGTICFLITITLGLMESGARPSFWLLLSLLELAHCSEVRYSPNIPLEVADKFYSSRAFGGWLKG
jgi:hypothetical protein